MKKYWWEVVQAAEFVDGSIAIERNKYLAFSMEEAHEMLIDYNNERNDGFVIAKLLGAKITGLEM